MFGDLDFAGSWYIDRYNELGMCPMEANDAAYDPCERHGRREGDGPPCGCFVHEAAVVIPLIVAKNGRLRRAA